MLLLGQGYQQILDAVGDARVVLIGGGDVSNSSNADGTHGTFEFYNERALITRALIEKLGFTAVLAEADFPDTCPINSYVLNSDKSIPVSALDALAEFKRFPKWMWRNEVMPGFIDWLRKFNDSRTKGSEKAMFLGMDFYNMNASIHAVIQYLEKTDSKAAAAAKKHYGCFTRFGSDDMNYAYALRFGLSKVL